MRVVTVRLSDELHRALAVLAHENRTTMNKLCVGLIEWAVRANPIAGAMYERREPRT